jgi:hypothetical protein
MMFGFDHELSLIAHFFAASLVVLVLMVLFDLIGRKIRQRNAATSVVGYNESQVGKAKL